MRIWIRLGVGAMLLTALLGGSLSTARAAPRDGRVRSPLYYLALGDSLAKGVEYSGETNQGYVDQLFAFAQQQVPRLQLVNLGCSGETLESMVAGGVCSYSRGSQLAQAEAFLGAHRGAVVLVTIDIGANDIIPCVSAAGLDQGCIANGYAAATNDLPVILSGLQTAAGGRLPLVGMNYYDPFLAEWLNGAAGETVAHASEALTEEANALLGKIYGSFQVPVADVQSAFQTMDFADQISLDGEIVPLNVSRICQWTWMCVPPAPQVPSIHPTTYGYSVITAAFENEIAFGPLP